MKTGLEKFKEWFDRNNSHISVGEVYDEMLLCIAEEADQKPTADKGLVEELRELLKHYDNGKSESYWTKQVWEILSRYEPKESLAELADRKGCGISWTDKDSGIWHLELTNGPSLFMFKAKTYAEAEAEARAWLNTKEDICEK